MNQYCIQYVGVKVVQLRPVAENEISQKQKRTDFNINLFVRNPIIYKQLIVCLLHTYVHCFQNTEHKTIFTRTGIPINR